MRAGYLQASDNSLLYSKIPFVSELNVALQHVRIICCISNNRHRQPAMHLEECSAMRSSTLSLFYFLFIFFFLSYINCFHHT